MDYEDDQESVQWQYSFRDSVKEWHALRHCDKDRHLHGLRKGRPSLERQRRNLTRPYGRLAAPSSDPALIYLRREEVQGFDLMSLCIYIGTDSPYFSEIPSPFYKDGASVLVVSAEQHFKIICPKELRSVRQGVRICMLASVISNQRTEQQRMAWAMAKQTQFREIVMTEGMGKAVDFMI